MADAPAPEVQEYFQEAHPFATHVSVLWNRWYTNRDQHRDLVKEVREYLNATDTSTTSNNQNPTDHKTHRPKLSQLADSLKSNYKKALIPSQDFLEFVSSEEEDEEKKARIEGYIRAKHSQTKFVEETIDRWLDTWGGPEGNCYGKVDFVEEGFVDPVTGEFKNIYTGPKSTFIDPDSIVFDITADDFRKTPKIIRYKYRAPDLLRWAESNKDNATIDVDQIKKAIDLRHQVYTRTTEDINKSHQLELDGFGTLGQYLHDEWYEVLEYYGDYYDSISRQYLRNHMITILDRTLLIRSEPLKTKTGYPHIYQASWRKRNGNLIGQGPFDNLIGLQYRINHLENTIADAVDRTIECDRVIAGDVEIVNIGNGRKEYRFAEPGGSVQNLSPDGAILQADFKIEQIERSMEFYLGLPSEASGFRSPGEKTKFEVLRLETARDRRFQSQLESFEVFLKDIVNAELELAAEFSTEPEIVPVFDDTIGSVDFQELRGADLAVQGSLQPIGAKEHERQARIAQDLMQLIQAMQIDPDIRLHMSSKKLAELFEQVLGLGKFDLYDPNIRIAEQAEAQQFSNAAIELQEEEEALNLAGQGFEESNI